MEMLNKAIDHAVRKVFAQEQHIETLYVETRKYGFASVCIDPYNIPLTRKLLEAGAECLGASAGAKRFAEA